MDIILKGWKKKPNIILFKKTLYKIQTKNNILNSKIYMIIKLNIYRM